MKIRLLIPLLFVCALHLPAQYSCGNTRTSSSDVCQLAAFGELDPTWTIINRHGEYGQSETECNVPSQVAVSNGNLTITTVAKATTCGDFNLNGTNRTAPASWPYTTGDIQWKSLNFLYGTITFRAKYPSSATSLWPSHWLLSSNCQQTNVMSGDVGFSGCPATGASGYQEIDMIECYNGLSWCSFNVYMGSNGNWHTCHMTPDMDTKWHTYKFNWTPTQISMAIDGADSGCTVTSGDYPIPNTPMFMIAQIQTGGVAGTPVNSQLPATLSTDFVRLQDSTGEVIFFDDFQTPVPPTALHPLSRLARFVGTSLSPNAIGIRGLAIVSGNASSL
jgi:beta-glucanase (GH16 family)